MVRDWRLVLCGLYVVGCVTLLSIVGAFDGLKSLIFGAIVLAMMIAPVLSLCLWPGQAAIKGVAALVIGGGGLWLIIDTMYFQPPDGQSALVFLVVPVLQIMAAAGFAALLAVIAALSHQRDDDAHD